MAVILNGKLKMAALAEAVGIAESAGEIADEALILKGLQLVAALPDAQRVASLEALNGAGRMDQRATSGFFAY